MTHKSDGHGGRGGEVEENTDVDAGPAQDAVFQAPEKAYQERGPERQLQRVIYSTGYYGRKERI